MDIALESLNLLVLEDSPTQLALLKEMLEKKIKRIRAAKDGVEGLVLVKEELPDLIISDIEMPRMDGYEFCRHIKADEKSKEVPVILLTNLTDPLDVLKGIDSGANAFLTKPCPSELLFRTITNAFKNKNLLAEYPKGKLEFYYEGKKQALEINHAQIMSLLLSTYSNAMQKNLELEESYRKLNRIHEELERNNEKLKKLNEQKNLLLGMAAHDMRNPLSVISGFSSYLLSAPRDKVNYDKIYQIVQQIYNSSNFMVALIEDLLDISSIESGTVSLHLSEVSLQDLVQQNLIFLETLAQKKNIKLMLNFKDKIPLFLCDSNKIIQIFNNLVSNAIKFSYPNGTVEIQLSSTNDEVMIAVKDYGVGMSPEGKKNLFQPFSVSKTQGTEGERGTGLGLAIVHKIVKEHKGKIWLDSELNKGTTFFVSLPINREAANIVQK